MGKALRVGAKPRFLPSKREILAELRKQIDAWRATHHENDGVVRDATALHVIRCLEYAFLIVQEHKFPTGQKK
jgi:hypothetical protein